jgi:hypothetical protein
MWMKLAVPIFAALFLVALAIWLMYHRGEPMGVFSLSSSAFENGALMPSPYTCDGANVSPPLSISGVPSEATSLVLVMDDPDVPKELKPDGVFDHWVMYGIDPKTTEIPEGALTGALGLNGAGEPKYTGPCPPPQYEPSEHRYFFRLYAVDMTLNFIKAPTKAEVLMATEGRVIAAAELMGRYKRVRSQ